MLVDDKFIIILIPRCATTSFVLSCQKNHIKTKSARSSVGGYDKIINLTTDRLTHYHDNITFLQSKFGSSYPIIAVKRERCEWFISMWKMILNTLNAYHDCPKLVKRLSEFTIDNILFFDKDTYFLDDIDDLSKIADEFFLVNNIEYNETLYKYLYMLYIPQSYYHKFNKNILWFDFNQLDKLEEWVSNTLGYPFKLENVNSSKNVKSALINDLHFNHKLNEIYDKYEIIKDKITLI
jgi:hypothetical protein